ncbi:MAG: tryptophan--tRNA ligase [Clostridia bacterium]|nr:tryptophan--tRNA ligase [Clostridia bacterium]
MEKKRIFSGIQPSGALTIGNYLGALKNWAQLIDEYDCIFSVVDLHAITVRQDPKELNERCLGLIAQYIACGIDPEKCTIFIQSHVPAHAELSWILNCYTYMGELERMTQFKDKSSRHADNINAGLFTYPVLMAADILLYQADLVPVGHDQKQHLELCRDVAERFNRIYDDTFKIPEGYIAKMGARVMDLQNPEKKMSKSEPAGSIALLEDIASVTKKIKRAQTDSLGYVKFEEGRHGINNLISIYGAVTRKTADEIENEFQGKGYGDFKKAIAEALVAELEPIQAKYQELMNNKDYLKSVYTSGADRAREIADETIRKVHQKIGYIER